MAISGGILASAFVAMFLLTFIGFQVVHIFQPFPGEKPSEPYAGIAVIFGGLLSLTRCTSCLSSRAVRSLPAAASSTFLRVFLEPSRNLTTALWCRC